jgi:hypothetical protein
MIGAIVTAMGLLIAKELVITTLKTQQAAAAAAAKGDGYTAIGRAIGVGAAIAAIGVGALGVSLLAGKNAN